MKIFILLFVVYYIAIYSQQCNGTVKPYSFPDEHQYDYSVQCKIKNTVNLTKSRQCVISFEKYSYMPIKLVYYNIFQPRCGRGQIKQIKEKQKESTNWYDKINYL